MATLQRRHVGGRVASPQMVRRPRGPSPPPTFAQRPPAGGSSSAALRQLLMQGLGRLCCQRRAPLGDSRGMAQQPRFQPSVAAVNGRSMPQQAPVATAAFPGINDGAPLQPNSSASSQSAGSRRAPTVVIPGLDPKRPARSLSRPRIGNDGVLYPTGHEHMGFSAAFQEFFQQEAQGLGSFVRVRSVTPPPCDLVSRALRRGNEVADVPLNFHRSEAETPLTPSGSTATVEPLKSCDSPSFRGELHVGSSPSRSSSSPPLRASKHSMELPLTHFPDVIDPDVRSQRAATASNVRERSPCFGKPEATPQAAEAPQDAAQSDSLRSKPAVRTVKSPPAFMESSIPTLAQFSKEQKPQAVGEAHLHYAPVRQVPRVRRHIRSNVSPRGRQIRSNVSPRGRAPALTRGHAFGCGTGTRHATARRGSRCDEGHSPSPAVLHKSASLSAVPVSLAPVGSLNFSTRHFSPSGDASDLSPLSKPAAISGGIGIEKLSKPEQSTTTRIEAEATTTSLKELLPVAPLTLPPATAGTGDPKETIGDVVCSMQTSQSKSKGTGKGKAPPPPSSGLAPPPASAKAGISRVTRAGFKVDVSKVRAASEGPWFSGRPLYWRELPGAKASHSIFDQTVDGGSSASNLTKGFDWDEWNELFGTREDGAESLPRRGMTAPNLSSAQGRQPLVCVLSHRQAFRCSVILHAVGDFATTSNRFHHLDFDALNEENVGRLRELVDIVEEAQVQQLRALSQQISRGTNTGNPVPHLRTVERRLLPLFDIDRVSAHIHLAHISCTLEAQRSRVTGAAAALRDAAKDAKNSGALKDLVNAAMSLRDYVQHGPQAPGGPPRVMDIGSLLSGLREFKAIGPDSKKVSLLHFFARSLLRMRPDFDAELFRQLPGLTDGRAITSGESPWPGLQDCLTQLKADAAFSKSELTEHSGAYGEAAITRLRTLCDAVANAATEAGEAIDAAASALEELGRYFGKETTAGAKASSASRKDPSGLIVLCQLAELLTGFRRTCGEVREPQSSMEGSGARLSCATPRTACGAEPLATPRSASASRVRASHTQATRV